MTMVKKSTDLLKCLREMVVEFKKLHPDANDGEIIGNLFHFVALIMYQAVDDCTKAEGHMTDLINEAKKTYLEMN